MEVFEENQQLLLVPAQNRFDLRRFLRIRHKHLVKSSKGSATNSLIHSLPSTRPRGRTPRVMVIIIVTHLEDMERLKLDVLARVSQHVHHHLQVRLVCDVPCHDVEVCPIQQELAEELQRLSLRDIVL